MGQVPMMGRTLSVVVILGSLVAYQPEINNLTVISGKVPVQLGCKATPSGPGKLFANNRGGGF